ncbi:hypothetical protein N7532_000960 [Penicillium argentinense]|uniref:Uncharacterized protein n=1 Tax=Penicillium argentinense TaxID=1131581 RepID=A0A9W9G1L9_9EURO|nr:uncharacterized protein N7532_000960 [Penicillium argentinense]KAJ5110425.1 hypothetical protein N7532_000960 [Penicillium argentinense]
MLFSFTLLALLANMTTAFPFMKRDIQWSFDLYPSSQCDSDGDLHSGAGSTGCRADLNSMAAAYRLNAIAPGCQVEFFDNTMCEQSGTSDVVFDLSTGAESCQVPSLARRYGSYQVTCNEGHELKM